MQTIIKNVDKRINLLKDALTSIESGERGETLAIELRIGGGCPGQRLDCRVSLSSGGQAEVSHADELHALNKQFSSQVPGAEVAAVAALLDIESILQLPPNSEERYVPDSLVGKLTVSVGDSILIFVFPILDEEPKGEATSTMTIRTDSGNFFVSSSDVPAVVQPLFDRLATIIGNVLMERRTSDSVEPFESPYGPCPYVGERSFRVNECIYGWTARYFQNCTAVTVRIQLNPDEGITAQVMADLRTIWATGIVNKWSERFSCSSPYGNSQITFAVQWVQGNAHHVVRVRQGTATTRSNMTLWDTTDSGDVAAHEFGHMIGNPDEYTDDDCRNRFPINTGTVMDNTTGPAQQRHVDRICRSASLLPDEHFSIGLDLI